MSAPRLALLALFTLLLDQGTKFAALLWLVQGVPQTAFPGLDLTLGFNEGASFGILSGVMAGRPWLMATLTSAITAAFAFLALRAHHRCEATGFALVVGGSLGNILDRLTNGAVTDFLDVNWQTWHWPAFNLADIAITCGAGLILASALIIRGKESNDA